MDRHAILIALAKANRLTPDRALFVRTKSEYAIHRALREWKVTKPVFRAAGIEPLLLKHKTPLTDNEIQRKIDIHLMLLGEASVPFIWLPNQQNYVLDGTWQLKMFSISGMPLHPGISAHASKILTLSNEPAWQLMIELIQHGIEPYGPRTYSNGTRYFQLYSLIDREVA